MPRPTRAAQRTTTPSQEPAPIRAFWLEPTELVRVSLRRWSEGPCPRPRRPGERCWARATLLSEAPVERWAELTPAPDNPEHSTMRTVSSISRRDARWPTRCASCGTDLAEDAAREIDLDVLMKGAPGGRLVTLRDPPAGAMWDAWWMPEWYRGPDGICLMVRTPDGYDWMVDGEASNCDQPQRRKRADGVVERTERTHYCWVRHGDPKTGAVHVDKGAEGESCGAGAGSIQTPNWHGFLDHGLLTTRRRGRG